MKHGRPQWGEAANVGAAPLKNHENKRFATYSSLWGAFSPCEGLSATFFIYGNPFSSGGRGFFCYFFHLMGGLFRNVGLFAILFSL